MKVEYEGTEAKASDSEGQESMAVLGLMVARGDGRASDSREGGGCWM